MKSAAKGKTCTQNASRTALVVFNGQINALVAPPEKSATTETVYVLQMKKIVAAHARNAVIPKIARVAEPAKKVHVLVHLIQPFVMESVSIYKQISYTVENAKKNVRQACSVLLAFVKVAVQHLSVNAAPLAQIYKQTPKTAGNVTMHVPAIECVKAVHVCVRVAKKIAVELAKNAVTRRIVREVKLVKKVCVPVLPGKSTAVGSASTHKPVLITVEPATTSALLENSAAQVSAVPQDKAIVMENVLIPNWMSRIVVNVDSSVLLDKFAVMGCVVPLDKPIVVASVQIHKQTSKTVENVG